MRRCARLHRIVLGAWCVAGWTAGVRGDETPDLTGTWKVKQSWLAGAPERKPEELTLHLEQAGERVTGRLTGPGGDALALREGQFAKGVLRFSVSRGGSPADYSGRFEGETLKGRVSASATAGRWEATREPAGPAELVGRWHFEAGAVGNFLTLDLQPDGGFVFEHRDVPLRSTVTTEGDWTLEGFELVLRGRRQVTELDSGAVFPGEPPGSRRMVRFAVVRLDGKWVLKQGSAVFRKRDPAPVDGGSK